MREPRYCKCCGCRIPDEKVAKYSKSKPPQFYDREYFRRWRHARGFYLRFGGLGIDAQRKIKGIEGHAPGYENRCAALAKVRYKGGHKRKK